MAITPPIFPDNLWDGLTGNRNEITDTVVPNAEDWDRIRAEVVSLEEYILDNPPGQAVGPEPDLAGVVATLQADGNLVDSGKFPYAVVNAKEFGVVMDGKISPYMSMGAGGTTVTNGDGNFTSGDVGKTIIIANAGASGNALITTIATFINGTTITVALASSGAVSNVFGAWGTDNAATMALAVAAVKAPDNLEYLDNRSLGKKLIFETGIAISSTGINVGGQCEVAGDSAGGTTLFLNDNNWAIEYTTVSGFITNTNVHDLAIINPSGGGFGGSGGINVTRSLIDRITLNVKKVALDFWDIYWQGGGISHVTNDQPGDATLRLKTAQLGFLDDIRAVSGVKSGFNTSATAHFIFEAAGGWILRNLHAETAGGTIPAYAFKDCNDFTLDKNWMENIPGGNNRCWIFDNCKGFNLDTFSVIGVKLAQVTNKTILLLNSLANTSNIELSDVYSHVRVRTLVPGLSTTLAAENTSQISKETISAVADGYQFTTPTSGVAVSGNVFRPRITGRAGNTATYTVTRSSITAQGYLWNLDITVQPGGNVSEYTLGEIIVPQDQIATGGYLGLEIVSSANTQIILVTYQHDNYRFWTLTPGLNVVRLEPTLLLNNDPNFLVYLQIVGTGITRFRNPHIVLGYQYNRPVQHGFLNFLNGESFSYADSIPTSGYYTQNSIVFKRGNTITNMTIAGANVQYMLTGWRRITESNNAGSNHTLNTDWVEMRTLTGTVS